MKKGDVLIVMLSVLLLLSSCTGPARTAYPMPDEGTWYCSELEVYLVFDRENQVCKPSTAIINGEEITCICSSELYTQYISLICQETGVPGVGLGDSLYWWTLIEYSDTEMLLEDYETGQQYSFLRVESQ